MQSTIGAGRRAEARQDGFALFLFGSVRLTFDGEALARPPGNQAKALGLLVLNGGCMNRDTLVERLWPDTSVPSGRHQLRSLLAKLRTSTGVSIVRQDNLVVLEPSIWCDIERFIVLSSRAVSGVDGPQAARRLGLQAQALWTGPPLESWRYEDWAIRVRGRVFALQERLWALLDESDA
jgi:DNA-binding SARP family transcriptional activator